MFERKDGLPLWGHVAAGVSVGLVVGGVALYSLWLWHAGLAVERALSRVTPVGSVYQRVPPVAEASSLTPRRFSPCPERHVLGALNGVLVCVSPAGEVTDIAR